MHLTALNPRVFSEKGLEESLILPDVYNSTGLSDTVHAQHRGANINSFQTCLGCKHWTDGRPTGGVILHNEVLYENRVFPLRNCCQHADKSGPHCIRHIPLIGVSLDDYPFLQLGLMLWVMLLWVVRVQSVGHIS